MSFLRAWHVPAPLPSTSLDGLLSVGLLFTDPDGQLYSMPPAQDEDPPTCADEFDDFVTYEASLVAPRLPLCAIHLASRVSFFRRWCKEKGAS